MRVGETVVVPGECMVAAKRGGSLEVHIEDGRDKHVYEGRVAVRRGQTTTVMLDEQQGSLTDARTKCRQTPIDSPFVAREPGD